MPPWLATTAGGIRIRVRVQPRASRSEVAGTFGDALRIRVAAPPVDGEANRELLRFLSRALGVPASAARIAHGPGGRTKLVEIDGVEAEAAIRALQGGGG